MHLQARVLVKGAVLYRVGRVHGERGVGMSQSRRRMERRRGGGTRRGQRDRERREGGNGTNGKWGTRRKEKGGQERDGDEQKKIARD